MEPPSLESVGSLEGQYQHDQDNMIDQAGQGRSLGAGRAGRARSLGAGQGSGRRAGQARSLGSYTGGDGSSGANKDCDKPNQGWRPASGYDKPMMRSLSGKKPCKHPGGHGGPGAGKGRDLDDDAVTPNIKMVGRTKEESPLQEVSRIQMSPHEDKAEERDLKPNIKEKV